MDLIGVVVVSSSSDALRPGTENAIVVVVRRRSKLAIIITVNCTKAEFFIGVEFNVDRDGREI